jgi:hypothetical protein
MGAVVSAARYAEPTAKQVEEAAALLFLAATQKALHGTEHIWHLKLELAVTYGFHNQRLYRVHATTETGETITGKEGYYVHPANGTPEEAAWSIALTARRAAAKRREATNAAADTTPAALRRESA